MSGSEQNRPEEYVSFGSLVDALLADVQRADFSFLVRQKQARAEFVGRPRPGDIPVEEADELPNRLAVAEVTVDFKLAPYPRGFWSHIRYGWRKMWGAKDKPRFQLATDGAKDAVSVVLTIARNEENRLAPRSEITPENAVSAETEIPNILAGSREPQAE